MDWDTIWTFAKPIIAGQVRTALAGVAASLATAGVIKGDESTAFISMGTGIVLYAIPAAWSWWQKVGSVKLLALMAKSKPVATPTDTTGEAVASAVKVAKAETAK
jgi:hypothetical protein